MPEPAFADVGQQRAEPQARLGPCGDQLGRLPRPQRRRLALTQAEIRGPGELALRHRQAAGELGQIFAKSELEDQRLGPAEGAGIVQTPCPKGELAQPLDRGRDPGECVAGELVSFEALGIDRAVRRHQGGELGPHDGENGLG